MVTRQSRSRQWVRAPICRRGARSGIDHPFGAPTGYELVHGDKRYAPKAVVGLACRYHLGRVLQPEEFSGGEAPGQANFVLRKLGFTVVRKDEEAAEEEQPAHKDWSEQEVGLIVADYFTMCEPTADRSCFSDSGSISFRHFGATADRFVWCRT